jgi:glutathione S-transferase
VTPKLCHLPRRISRQGAADPRELGDEIMASITLYGFPRSTFVKIVGLVLTAKGIEYRFHDTESEMYQALHRGRHPFRRVPVLQHGDFMVYETSAIVAYIDEVLDGPTFTPANPEERARMNQWISNVNCYFYPYMIYHVTHERLVFPELGIPGNDAIVARAMPHCREALESLELELADGRWYVTGEVITLADFYLYPMLFAFALAPEGKQLLGEFPLVRAWRQRMDAVPAVARFNAALPPRRPIEHAREWALSHRPAA